LCGNVKVEVTEVLHLPLVFILSTHSHITVMSILPIPCSNRETESCERDRFSRCLLVLCIVSAAVP